MKVIDLIQGSDAWREFRQGKIGASDCAAIMGLCPYKTPLMKWEEKIQGFTQVQTDAMRRGTELEPIARSFFNNLLKANFKPIVCQHEQHDWMIASLDGYDEETQTLVEIKCPSEIQEEVPRSHFAQMQHQFAVTGLKRGFYFQYLADGRYSSTAVDRDDEFIADLIMMEEKFYNSLLSFEPPEPTDSDFIVEENEMIIHLAETYQQIETQIKFLEEMKVDLRAKLVSNAKHNRMKVGPIKVMKVNRKGAVNYKSIPELNFVDLDKYRKPMVTYWEITCSKEEAIV